MAHPSHPTGEVLVIIPTYNEKENIILLIKAIFHYCPFVNILVVDDQSPDGTGQAVKDLQIQYPKKIHLINRPKKLGLGTAYIAGFQFALDHSYGYMITMDADFSHPPDKIITLYQTCKTQGYDLAIGSRYIEGIQVANWPWTRIILSYGANLLARIITGAPIKDLTAGFQCYRRTVIETLRTEQFQSIGYSFQIELKFWTWKNKFKIKEVPILFTNRVRGHSKMSHHIILEAFYRLILLKIKSSFKKFGQKP
jgi:dolichol-phosphate mannosyltransferase